jgi:GR25 family glycosyltransferase involved in LPS biosynthesis
MNINLFFDKIFYINLDKDTDRNVKIVEQFKRYDISNFERISGTVVDVVPDISYWRNFNQDKINEKYVLGGLGCRNSHWRIMKTALERGYNKILVLEDDIVFTKDPHQVLKDNMSKLDDWDMLYFGGTEESNFRGQIVGAYAYGLNRKLIEEIYYMLPTSGMEVDNFYAKVLFHMSYNYSKCGKYNIKKMEPFDTVDIDFKCISNIR